MGDNVYQINEIDKGESRCHKTDKIPLKDLFFLGDLEKYYKYGIFPYILFVHIFLVILTTALVRIINL